MKGCNSLLSVHESSLKADLDKTRIMLHSNSETVHQPGQSENTPVYTDRDPNDGRTWTLTKD